MQNTRLTLLFNKYLDKSATPQERAQLFAWLRDSSNKYDIEQEMEKLWTNFAVQTNPFSEQDKVVMLEKILHFTKEESVTSQKPVKIYRLFQKWAVAAVITIAVMAGGYFYYVQQNQRVETVAYQNDIAPGRKGATLTLGDGKKILIKDALAGNLANQSGVKISKTTDGQIVYEIANDKSDKIVYNTLSTTRGEQTQVRLPDGTVVFLNAESSLTYPTNFSKSGERRVSLTGEGYFEVAKDKKHPFIVKTDKQEVAVLGTHFNINAYRNEESIKTTLIEGRVKVFSFLLRHEITLKPGQQAVLNQQALTTNQANIDEALAWKNGEFRFDDKSISEIMKQIARWYDVTVIFNDQVPNGYLSGSISRNRNLSQVLKMIEKTKEVKFRIDGRKIYVNKYN
ncbi:FecR domain-containing protein [Pedobacter rhodius]|uniref:DUF4974 domain-containing protein n=1 Tax=Pedobacter rhodius TaxID=3004098 RepID=A0ABT4KUE1_9SPHI|nr:FecR domain-containing protein [Pedobacter sp. SJ11]MCZ4222549.1 DUF4974 domain-containing protein [Pedobacter sp. SJ11]